MEIPVLPIVFGILVLLRLLGFLATCPLLGLDVIPWRVRIPFAMIVAGLVTATLDVQARPPTDLLSIGMLGIAEVLVGLAIGLVVSLLVHGVQMGAQVAGMQMGLGFAMIVDPLTGEQSMVLSKLLGMMTVLVIMGFNGHLILIKGMAMSFQQLPPGEAWRALAGAAYTVPAAGVTLFMTAALVAAPAMAAIFSLKITMAVLARAAPQIHILAVGFIVTIVVGVLVLAWSLTGLGDMLRTSFEHTAEQALGILAVR